MTYGGITYQNLTYMYVNIGYEQNPFSGEVKKSILINSVIMFLELLHLYNVYPIIIELFSTKILY